jgi:Uri superfamily endonuclease
MEGTYLLLININENKYIKIGKLGKIFFKKGNYIYVGSALNGLEQRINRHLRSNKKTHWHIDYLLEFGKIINAYYKQGKIREECNFAGFFSEKLIPVPGFGSSDCNCKTHLFYDFNNSYSGIINLLDLKIFI